LPEKSINEIVASLEYEIRILVGRMPSYYDISIVYVLKILPEKFPTEMFYSWKELRNSYYIFGLGIREDIQNHFFCKKP